MRSTTRFWRGAALTAALGLAACGGSGGDGGTEGAPPGATLSALLPSIGSLTPAFDAATPAYVVHVPLATPSASVVPVAASPGATITVNGLPTPSGSPSAQIPLSHGANPVTVSVTPAGGGVAADYTVVFDTRAAGQEAYAKSSDPTVGQQFGAAVGISGNTIVVTAPYDDSGAVGVDGNDADASAPESGAAWVYVRSGSTWALEAYLKASNTEEADLFGTSVAISGDTLVVGAPNEGSGAGEGGSDPADDGAWNSGAAYVFR